MFGPEVLLSMPSVFVRLASIRRSYVNPDWTMFSTQHKPYWTLRGGLGRFQRRVQGLGLMGPLEGGPLSNRKASAQLLKGAGGIGKPSLGSL